MILYTSFKQPLVLNHPLVLNYPLIHLLTTVGPYPSVAALLAAVIESFKHPLQFSFARCILATAAWPTVQDLFFFCRF